MTISEILERKRELQEELSDIENIINQLLVGSGVASVNKGNSWFQPSNTESNNYLYGNSIQQEVSNDDSFSMPIGTTIDPYSVETFESLKEEVKGLITEDGTSTD